MTDSSGDVELAASDNDPLLGSEDLTPPSTPSVRRRGHRRSPHTRTHTVVVVDTPLLSANAADLQRSATRWCASVLERRHPPSKSATFIVIGILVSLAIVFSELLRSRHDLSRRPDMYDEFEKTVLQSMNLSIDPCSDFYNFACGGWQATHPIPPDKGSTSKTFSAIQEENIRILREIATASTSDAKLTTYYSACMNSEAVDAQGVLPLQNLFASLPPIQSLDDVMTVAGWLRSIGIDIFFSFSTEVDAEDPTRYIVSISQGGLLLPSIDDYNNADTVTAYQQHVVDMMHTAFRVDGNNVSLAREIVEFERRIANFSKHPDEMRDPTELYNGVSFKQFRVEHQDLAWTQFLSAAKMPLSDDDIVNVAQPVFLASISRLLDETSVDVLRNVIRWRVLNAFSVYLSENLAALTFDFFHRYLVHIETRMPRWKFCIASLDKYLGELLGKEFVKRRFSPAAKSRAHEMVKFIEESFMSILQRTSWMDAATKSSAIDKLRKTAAFIGYPDRWTDYSSLPVTTNLFSNVLEARRFLWTKELLRFGKSVDKSEWQMTPSTVNAYYAPSYNALNFPSGILQSPFYNESYPAAMNFGGIGSIIGHELVHAFDDEGRKYSASGQLHDWWSKMAADRFKQKSDCFVRQYAKFRVVEGARLNGALTLGENIADCGGLQASHLAWREFVSRSPTMPRLMKKFNDEQLFFIAFGQSWCSNTRPDVARHLLESDPHSPSDVRVNGAVANSDAFQRLFKCPARTEPMCQLWT